MAELQIDLNSSKFVQDKYGYIDELRAQSFYARIPEGVVFFNQEEAMHVMRCVDFRFSFFQIDPEVSPYLAASIEHELLNMHGEAHARLQKIVIKALRDRVVEGLRDKITGIVNDLIDEMPGQGVVDFTKDFCDPLPSRVMGPMFGIPYADIEGLDEWIKIGGRKVDALQSGDGIDKVEMANRNLHDYLRKLLAERSNTPGNDIISELMIAEVDGDRLSDEELVYLTSELASAGVDTTRSQLPLILHELLVHPDQLIKLRETPRLALHAVDEGMRFAPLPWALPHAAIRDCEYKGIKFKKNDLVMILIPAANRDPSVIENPHIFDISRSRARNFSFGFGMHACPASQLARMEMSVALEILFSRIGSMKLVEPPVREPIQKGEAPTKLLVKIIK